MFWSRNCRATLAASALAALAAGMPDTAAAQAKTTLRVADHYPVGAPTAQYTAKFFMDAVKEATKGEIDFQYYPSEQLGKAKDMLTLTQQGVIDIGLAAPSYISDKMPLSGVAELPGTFATSCEGTMAYWKLARGGVIEQKEFGPNGVRVMLAVVLPPYQILTRGKLESAADLEGLKLRSGGGAMDLTVLKLKATPVRLPGPDIYESLSRGTLDGLVFPLAAVLQFNLQNFLKSGTVGENFGGFAVTYVMAESKWKQLSPAAQKAMLDAGEATTRHACSMADRDNEPSLAKLRERGIAMNPLPAAEQAKVKEAVKPVLVDWAEQLDKRGKPGSEVLKAFTDALAIKAN